jgi:hypothetical protein
MITLPSGRHVTVKNAAGLVKPGMWQRMRTGSATKGARDYHWAMIEITPDDTPEGHDDGHAFLLLRRHRYTATVGVSSPVRWEKRACLGLFRATIVRVVYAVAQRAAADRRSVPGTGLDHGRPAGGVESTISLQYLAVARLPGRAASFDGISGDP